MFLHNVAMITIRQINVSFASEVDRHNPGHQLSLRLSKKQFKGMMSHIICDILYVDTGR